MVANTLLAMSKMDHTAGIHDANKMIDNSLACCMYATRSAMYGSLEISPVRFAI
jgi:hypothetical protein